MLKSLLVVGVFAGLSVGLAAAQGAFSSPAAASPSTAVSAAELAQARQPGSLRGRVTNPDGSPAENVLVRLYQLGSTDGGAGGGADGLMQRRGAGGPDNMGNPAAARRTDAEGNFTIPRLNAGSYQLIAGERRGTTGYASSMVQIKAGEETVHDFALALPG